MSNAIGNQNLVHRAKAGIEVAIRQELERLEKDFGVEVDSIYVDLHKSITGMVLHPQVTQGFVDQYGSFYNRQEAWKIAEQNGQVLRRVGGDTSNGGTLYSENLY